MHVHAHACTCTCMYVDVQRESQSCGSLQVNTGTTYSYIHMYVHACTCTCKKFTVATPASGFVHSLIPKPEVIKNIFLILMFWECVACFCLQVASLASLASAPPSVAFARFARSITGRDELARSFHPSLRPCLHVPACLPAD